MNKLSLSREQLEQEMLTKSIRQIVRETGNTSLNYWVKKWGLIPKYSKVKSQVLTNEQKSIITGSLFGDGSLDKVKDTCYFRETHCAEQFEYIQWKYLKLNNLSHRELKTNNKGQFYFRLGTHEYTDYLYNVFYKNGVRILPDNAIELINPLSLAVWFMDDGTKNSKYNISIATHKYPLEDHERLVEIFLHNFNIIATIQPCKVKGKQMYYLRFNKSDGIKFCDLVKPHIVPSMSYKLITD